jgi:hypothetical protein
MAEEIITSPEESVSMEAPIVEAPIDVQEEVVDINPTPPTNTKGVDNFKKLHGILAADEVYSQIVPSDFNQFLSKYSDVKKLQKLHGILAADDVYSQIMPADLNQAADKYGFGGLGKPSAVPSPSVSGGSATKGRGVEQPSTLQPRKASEVEQSVMGYGLPKTIDIGGGKAKAEEELRLPTEGEFGAIEKMPLTKEAKLEEAVRLGTPPVERVAKDITQNKNNLLSTEKELKKVEQELSGYKQQSDSLLAIYNNEALSPQERNKAGEEYNKVNEIAAPLTEKYNSLANNYNGYIANEKVLFGDLDKAEKMRQKGLEKEYSHLLNLKESVERDLIKAVTGVVSMGSTISDLIPNFGLITPEQEEAGKKSLIEGLNATNEFADKLISQETPEGYKKLFQGDFSLGKLAYITTNAVSSSIPTVAAGFLTGGTGAIMAGAGLAYHESKSIMKDAGLSDEQADWAALGLAIPIGFLEKYGADDAVRLLNGSGIRREVAKELAKKVAGKSLSREALFLEAKKTLGEVIKAKTGRILASGGKESLTEVSQGELQELTKQVVQEFTGVDKDEDMSTADYLQQQFMQRAEEAAGGFLGGTTMSGAGVAFNAAINKKDFSQSAYAKAMQFTDPAKFQQFQNDLMLEVQNGVLTEEQANDAITNVQAIQETNALIPNSVQNLDLRTDAVNLIIEKNDLIQEIEGKDPDLIVAENTRLAEIKKSLNEIALGNKPSVAEQQAAIETAPAPPSEATPVSEAKPTTEAEPQAPTITSENQVSIDNRSRKDLFPDESQFADVIGGSGQSSKISSYREVNGIGISEYTNPENGLVDVIMTGTSDNDYVGYVRIYENGKPTNRWTSKMENKSGNKANFKTMINEVKSSLPEGHEYTEKTNISLDGLRVFAKNLQKGYEYLRDKAGEIVTNNVELNNATLEKLRGAKTKDEVRELYERKTGITREEFNKIKEKVESILPNTRLIFNETNGSVIVRLPVLVSNQTTQTAPTAESQPTTEAQTTTEEAPQAEATTEENARIDNFTGEAAKIINQTRDNLLSDIERYKEYIEEDKPKTRLGKLANIINNKKNETIGRWKELTAEAENELAELDANPIEYFKRKKDSSNSEEVNRYYQDNIDILEENKITPQAETAPLFEAPTIEAPTQEQEAAPQPFPAQEGAESEQKKDGVSAELEQIYRDLNAAVIKNVDKDTIRMLKEKPTEAMVDKALRELQSKGVIKIDCN